MSSKEFNLRREREIVGSMISLLRRGVFPWRSPYPAGSLKKVPYNFSTEDDYHGANQVMLLADCWKSNYATPAFMGEKQGEKMGGALKPGARPVWVVTARVAEVPVEGENGAPGATTPVVHYFWNRVYNYDQFEGLPELKSSPTAYAVDMDGTDNLWEAISFAEAYMRNQGIRVKESEKATFPVFTPSTGVMTLPGKEMFARIGENPELLAEYASKLIRECAQSTAVPLERFAEQRKRGGKDDLDALENLVTEISSSVLLNRFNLKAPEPKEHVEAWIGQVQKNHKSLFRAFRDADRAAKHIEHTVGGMAPAQTQCVAKTAEVGR